MTLPLHLIKDGQVFVLLSPNGSVPANVPIIKMNGSFFLAKHDTSPYGEPLEITDDPITVPIIFPSSATWRA